MILSKDKRIAVLALFLVLTISLYLSFSQAGISESGYMNLLGKDAFLAGFGIGLVKILTVLAAFVSASILFIASVGVGKEYEKEALLPSALTSIVLLLSPFVSNSIGFVFFPAEILALPFFILGSALIFSKEKRIWAIAPFVIGMLLAYPHVSMQFKQEMFSNFPLIIAIGAISIGHYFGQKKNEALTEIIAFISGFTAIFILTPLALGLLANVGSRALKKLFSETEKVPLLIFVFALVIAITIQSGDIKNAVIIAGSITVLAYFILSLYYFEITKFVPYLMLALIAFSFSFTYFWIVQNQTTVIDSETIAALEYAKEKSLNMAVLDLPYAYEFYTGKKANVVNGTELLTNSKPNYEYILLRTKTLPSSFAQYPVAFGFYATSLNSDGTISAVYVGGPYILTVPLDNSGKIAGDGVLFSAKNGDFIRSLPFTKLKQLDKKIPLENKTSVLINIEGYEDTEIYNIIMKDEKAYENDYVKIVRVE